MATFGFNGTECAACEDPYCQDCGADVTQCKNCTGQGWLDGSGMCQELPENCTAADSSGACTACYPGWGVSSGACVECQAGTGCVECNPANLKASTGGGVEQGRGGAGGQAASSRPVSHPAAAPAAAP